MKLTNILKGSFLALIIVGFVACKDKEKTETPTDPSNESVVGLDPVTEELTPEESVQRFTTVAQELTNTFNTADQKAVVELVDVLIYNFDEYEYDWDAFEEYYEGDRYSSMWETSVYVAEVASGKRLASQVSDYTFKFSNESVVFEADDNAKTWVCKGPSSDNSLQMIYTVNGSKCVAKLWGEGATKTYTQNIKYDYTEWEPCYEYVDEYGYTQWVCPEHEETFDKTYTVEIPEKIIFTLTEDGVEHVRLEIKLDMQKNNHINFDLAGKLANMTWNTTTKVNSTNASFTMDYKYNSMPLITCSAVLPSYVVFDKNDSETWEEWIERYGDEYETLLKKIGGATANVDLMSRIQIKSSLKNGGDFYTAYRNWEEIYDYYDETKEWYEQPSDTREANVALADIYNNNIDVNMHFSSDIVQAQLKMDAKQYTSWDYVYDYNGYNQVEVSYYDIMPVLYFPKDGSSYEFEEYFTEGRFSSVLNWAEELINKYIKLFRYLDVEEVEI